ncbi:MAG: hypothetical protein IT460_03235 [Planctomycetes bacterium]|nr:hypothetical protein [Planctomycetota bacterium]
MRWRLSFVPVAWLASLLLGGGRAAGEPDPKSPAVVKLHGLLRGAVLRLEPYFRFEPKEEARFGVLGTAVGTTREFEELRLEVGADRSVVPAALRAGFEAYRIKREVARGEPQQADVKADVAVVRLKNPFRDSVYVSAVRAVGRTVVFVRGECAKKDEAALVRVAKATAAGVTLEGDAPDAWLPAEVKATWNRTPGADVVLVDDGTLDEAAKAAIGKGVRDAYAVVRKLVPGAPTMPGPAVVRVTKNRDLFSYVSGRRDVRALDALYLPWAAELLVCPRKDVVDGPQLAAEAASMAVHHLLGCADAQPVLEGLRRMAAAAAAGVPAGAFTPADEAAAFARVKAHEAETWNRLMMRNTFANFLGEDADVRGIDAELAVGYLLSPGAAVGKASFAAWVTAMRKSGHPDAGSEGAVGAMDGAKSDAEYWAYWGPKADPPKKPGKGGK